MSLNSDFSKRLGRFLANAPGEIVLNAGFMDRETYSQFHTDVRSTNRQAAARLGQPGRSDIERGFGAIADIPESARKWTNRNAAQYGLNIDDNWYITPLGHSQQNPHSYNYGAAPTGRDLMDAAFGELHNNVRTNADLTDIPLSDEVTFSDPPVEAPSPHGPNPQLSPPQKPQESMGIGGYAEFIPEHKSKSYYEKPTAEYLDNLAMFDDPYELIHAGEGTRLKDGEHTVYLDGLDNMTGGHGHLIDANEINPETNQPWQVGETIPTTIANAWFEDDYRVHEQRTRAQLIEHGVDVDSLSPNLYMHLVDFVFNQGSFIHYDEDGNTKGWPQLVRELAAGDYEAAAQNIWSDWFTSYENKTGKDFEMGDGTYDRKLRLTLALLEEAARS